MGYLDVPHRKLTPKQRQHVESVYKDAPVPCELKKYYNIMTTMSSHTQLIILLHCFLGILFHIVAVICSGLVLKRVLDVKNDFQSCPDAWLNKQGNLMKDFGISTFCFLVFALFHLGVKAVWIDYDRIFDCTYALFRVAYAEHEEEAVRAKSDITDEEYWVGQNKRYECAKQGVGPARRFFLFCNTRKSTGSPVGYTLYKYTSVVCRTVETFIMLACVLLPTIMWAYFYIFPFDTLRAFAYGKLLNDPNHYYEQIWRDCIPVHTDEIYNKTAVMLVSAVSAQFLWRIVDFGKNPGKAFLWSLSVYGTNSHDRASEGALNKKADVMLSPSCDEENIPGILYPSRT
ncbi:hypothetical protein CYMTET_38957 [Cymbomonas tetramitiformis]|uniref:Uncharacterized protein n=1 Tax=Cymbomonas tetramitiformis TaxID=36881 RepID=A0AAE0CB00_9CHLO|nr:hypothetical protein CYMTET_38957 [Cymbomonas tetramitiformis]